MYNYPEYEDGPEYQVYVKFIEGDESDQGILGEDTRSNNSGDDEDEDDAEEDEEDYKESDVKKDELMQF